MDYIQRGVFEICREIEHELIWGNRLDDSIDALRYATVKAKLDKPIDLKGKSMTIEDVEHGLEHFKQRLQEPWKPCHHIVGRRPDVKYKDKWYYVCVQCHGWLPTEEVDKALNRTMEDWFSPSEWRSVYDAMRERGLNADILNPMPMPKHRNTGARFVHTDGKPLDAFEAYQYGIMDGSFTMAKAVEHEIFNLLAHGQLSKLMED